MNVLHRGWEPKEMHIYEIKTFGKKWIKFE